MVKQALQQQQYREEVSAHLVEVSNLEQTIKTSSAESIPEQSSSKEESYQFIQYKQQDTPSDQLSINDIDETIMQPSEDHLLLTTPIHIESHEQPVGQYTSL
jgi:hypothetical protein